MFKDLAQHMPSETLPLHINIPAKKRSAAGRDPNREATGVIGWRIRARAGSLRTLCAICYAHFGSPIEREKERERESECGSRHRAPLILSPTPNMMRREMDEASRKKGWRRGLFTR